MRLSELWEEEAENWATWARKPGHDVYWDFSGPELFELLPAPGGLAVELGCGEGRVCRDLEARGYRTIGVDLSPTLIRLAREADPEGDYLRADAGSVPLQDGVADLVVAFNSLIDIEDMAGAVREAARLLCSGGRFCICVPHPFFDRVDHEEPGDAESRLILTGSYFEETRGAWRYERDGVRMTFHSVQRPLESYARALETAGLLIEAIREPPVNEATAAKRPRTRFLRIAMFLFLRAMKP